MKAVDIDTMSWEGLAADRTKWRSVLKQHIKTGKDKLMTIPQRTSEHAERRAAAPSDPNPYCRCVSARKTATLASGFSVINDAGTTQQVINTIKNKNKYIRMYHPWSSLTEGSLYDYTVSARGRHICSA